MRSWTHDSELTAAVLDSARDPSVTRPIPVGWGTEPPVRSSDPTRAMLREHLGLEDDDDCLVDPVQAADMVARAPPSSTPGTPADAEPPAARRETARGSVGKKRGLPARHRWFTAPIYRSFLDPDGRPLDMRLRRTY